MDELNTKIVEPGRSRERMMKILVPVFVAIFIVILVLVKKQNPGFPLKYVIIIGATILVLGVIAFFGFGIAHKFKNSVAKAEDKKVLPEPASTEILWTKAKNALTNRIYKDHVKDYVQTINHSVGKNMKSLVVEFQVVSLYRPREACSILLNANYPDRLPTVLFNAGQYALKQAIQSMSFDPEDPANETETILKNEMTGTTSIKKEKNFNRKNISDIDKKEALL